MRAMTLVNRPLRIDGVRVIDVDLGRGGPVVVQVASRRSWLACPRCDFTTSLAYDRRGVDSRWRHLDLGRRECWLRMRRRRLDCPEHGVLTEAVPFARAASGFTTDFEDLVVWLTTRADKTTVSTFAPGGLAHCGGDVRAGVGGEVGPAG